MKIFLSHRSRDKPLVNDFKQLLPPFLNTWLDDESLAWGISLETELRSTVQSGVDFLVIFLDNDALRSKWVRQELGWAIQRERELKRTFVLPVLLPEAVAEDLPPELSQRVFLRLSDYSRASIESLARKATEKLFQLVVESYSCLQLEVPRPKSLKAVRDELSAGQAKILGYVVEQCRDGAEVTQRYIENAMQHAHASPELYYRLETLIQQGFLAKRRISADGMFSYRLTEAFQASLSNT
jgi:TIR domain-containing protein